MAGSDATAQAQTYVLIDPAVPAMAEITDDRIGLFTERHRYRLAHEPVFEIVPDVATATTRKPAAAGVLLKLDGGVPSRMLLRTTSGLLKRRRKVYFFWPAEGAIEVIDDLRLASYWRHWLVFQVHRRLWRRGDAVATAGQIATGAATANVFQAMRTSAATISAECQKWAGLVGQIVQGGGTIDEAARGVDAAIARGTARDLLTALEACGNHVEATRALLATARLALNRIDFCLDDLTKSAVDPSMASEIDPTHLQGIRQGVSGAGQQIADVEAAFGTNLPGIRNTANMARHNVTSGSGETPARDLDPAVRENAVVVVKLGTALAGYCRQVAQTAEVVLPTVSTAHDLVIERVAARETGPLAGAPPAAVSESPPSADAVLTQARLQLKMLRETLKPVPLKLAQVPDRQHPLPGFGLYLRTDYWAPIISGGSYGHTCYQARALARTTERFACLMSNRFPLLDDIGLQQVVVRPDSFDSSEVSLVRANEHYYQALRTAVELARPAYLFERACLGNFVGARLSSELGIPYLVEYNGSEISMKRSFDTKPYQLEDIYLEAELATFEQATAISVISDAVRDDVVKRGIDPAKVLVNWNAVDLDAYGPLSAPKRETLRRELGFAPGHRVVCFIGTFGGWHGIDVLAAAMPEIAKTSPDVRFLLIGDGNFKHIVHDVIEKHRLACLVVDCGRVPQSRGAELMGAADIFVSPHSSHMVDSRFFGSPTKLFEYMAYGVGIVASDLEQIGEIMRPSLHVGELAGPSVAAGEARGVLSKPGDVAEFAAGVAALVRQPQLAAELGRNARRAAENHFTWDGHVAKLWHFLSRRSSLGDGRSNGHA